MCPCHLKPLEKQRTWKAVIPWHFLLHKAWENMTLWFLTVYASGLFMLWPCPWLYVWDFLSHWGRVINRDSGFVSLYLLSPGSLCKRFFLSFVIGWDKKVSPLITDATVSSAWTRAQFNHRLARFPCNILRDSLWKGASFFLESDFKTKCSSQRIRNNNGKFCKIFWYKRLVSLET